MIMIPGQKVHELGINFILATVYSKKKEKRKRKYSFTIMRQNGLTSASSENPQTLFSLPVFHVVSTPDAALD